MGPDEPELLQSVDSGGTTTAQTQADVRRGGIPILPLAVVAVLLGAWVLAAGWDNEGSGPAAPPIPEQPTSSPAAPAGVTDPEIGKDGQATSVAATKVVAVVTSPSSEGARLLTVDPDGDVVVDELLDLAEYAFDPSGRWLAGLGPGSLADRPGILWAGPVGEPMEPVAIGVRSFAWHDGTPGVIGWSEAGGDVVITDLDGSTGEQRISPAASGRLQGLGAWGLAIETSPRDFATAFLASDGALVKRLPGRYRGQLNDGRLLLGGGMGPPLLFNPASGEVEEVPWLGAEDDLWRITKAGSPARAASPAVALVARNGNLNRPLEIEVVRIDDGDVTVEGLLGAVSPVGVASDGAIVVVEQWTTRPDGRGTIRLTGGSDEAVLVPLPDVLSGPEWVAALAAR